MNIYEVLDKIVVNERYKLSSMLYDDKYRDGLIEKDVILHHFTTF